MADSFVFYESFYKAAKRLRPEKFKEAMLALCEYALYGEDPDLDGREEDDQLCIFFDMAQPQIDANKKRYNDGMKGGRPKGGNKKPVVSELKTSGYEVENQWLRTSKPNVNVNDNVNVNANANDTGNENVNETANANKTVLSGKAGTPSLEPDPSGLGKNPTLEEVTAYGHQIGHPTLAAKFWKLNAERAWSINGEPIRDWKKLFDSWAKKERDVNAGLIGAGSVDYDAILTEFATAQRTATGQFPSRSGPGTATEARAAPGGPQVLVDENGVEYAEVKRR